MDQLSRDAGGSVQSVVSRSWRLTQFGMLLLTLTLAFYGIVGKPTSVDAATKTVYYYFYDSGAPKGPLGDEFVVLRVRGSKVWMISGMWGSEGAWAKGTVSTNKVSVKYTWPDCSGGTTSNSWAIQRKGSRSSISIKGYTRGLMTTSLKTLDKKYVSLAKAMYPGQSTSWIESDYFTQEFRLADSERWLNGSYC